MSKPYWKRITFNGKEMSVIVNVNRPKDHKGYHYDIEIRTNEKLTGNEFQLFRKYLEDEGYIDEAEVS